MPLLGNVEPAELFFTARPEAHRLVQRPEHHAGGHDDPADEGEHADDLDNELLAVAVDEAGDAVATVGEDAHGEDAPEAGTAVDGDRADDVVDAEDTLDDVGRAEHDRDG